MLLNLARQTIERYHMLDRGQRLVVAVSGGRDSVALLDVLATLRDEYGLALHVAHLNHKLRPEADEESEFVRALAGQFGLPVTVEAADVRALAARDKLSIEHAGRNARREFLLHAAQAIGAPRVAFGHHADDRVETVLLRLLRGTGVDGLAGMRPVAGAIIRPLFDATRAQVEAYVAERDLPYRDDPSNRDPAFLRNRVRWELLPLMESLQPGCKSAILRLSELADEERTRLFLQASQAMFRILAEHTPQAVTLRLAAFTRQLTPAMRRRVLREAIRLLLGDVTDIEQGHIEAALRLAEQSRTGARVHLPRRVTVERGYRTLIVRVGEHEPGAPVGAFALRVPGETDIPPLGITVTAELLARGHAPSPREEPANAAQVDYASLREPLMLRAWRRGDRFQPLGMAGTMKVHDFFVNQKVARAERDRVAIIASGDNIVWIVGMRLDERFKVAPATETVLRLEARPAGE